jgi:tape measure domain-containing protein
MAELGVGYISIVPEVSKISPGIAKALKASEGAADSTGDSMGSKISSKLGGALKKGAIGAGVSAGGVLAASITKGLGRLNSIEQAEAKLKGLGNSTQQVGSIMENALASVNGTAFGLEEAATTAGSLVAAGIKPGQELEGVLTTVADTATIAGRSMSDMGLIFGSVAAKGKLQGDDMLQLLAGGIPVLQLLADETGKTSAEISDMVSNGEVDFALFERAMKRGMGGAALEAGNTVQGAFKNMGAAAGRLGATIAGPFFTQAAGGFSGVTKALDDLNGRMKPVMADMASWLTGTAIPALKDFGQQGAEGLRNVWQAFKDSGRD